MSLIQTSTSTIASPYATMTATSRPLGKFEQNARDVGPVAASVIGVADALGEGASATVSLSSRAAAALEGAGRAVAGAVEGAGHSVSDAVDDVEQAAGEGWQAISNGASAALDKATTIAHEVSDDVGAAVDKVGDAATAVLNGVQTVAGTAASYASMATRAGQQLVDAFV